MSKNVNLYSAATIGLISRIISITIRFFSLPLMLSIISKERYGLWLIILSFIGWLGMSDLGIPSALQNRLIYLYENNYIERAKNLLSFGFKILFVIGLLIFTVFTGLIYYLPINKLFSINDSLTKEFITTLIICLFSFSIRLPSRIGIVIYNTHGKLIQQPLFELNGNIISFLLLLAIVQLKIGTLYSLAITNVSGLTIGGAFVTIIALKKYNYRIFSPSALSEDKKAVLKKGGYFFFATIGELFIFQSDALLIGFVAGPSKVPYYLIPATLYINFLLIQNIWLRPLWPVLTSLFAKNDFNAISVYFWRTILISVIASIAFGIGIVLFGNKFIFFWSHSTVNLSAIMALGLAIYTLIASVDNTIVAFLNALGKIEYRLFYTLFFGAFKIIIGYIMLKFMKDGIDYLPIAYALVMLSCSTLIGYYKLQKTIKINFKDIYLSSFTKNRYLKT